MPNSKKQKNTPTPIKQSVISSLPRFLWLRRNFAYCLGVSSIIWIVVFCYYVENFIGWESILAIAPADFGEFVLASTLPLLAVWFILAYIDRSSGIEANAELLQSYLNSLMYPDEASTQSAKAFATALRSQVEQLQKENKQALFTSAQLKTDLENRIADFSKIISTLDNYSAKSLIDLNDGIKSLADRCTYITNKTNNTVSKIQDCTADITQNSDKFLSKITPILDEISAVSSNIKSNISDNKENLTEIKKQLSDCVNLSSSHINTMVEKISESASRVEDVFYKTTEEYNALYKRLDSSISGIEGKVEEQKRLLSMQTNVINHNSELLSDKLSNYGKIISSEIDKLVKNSIELEKMTKKQVGALKTVSTETHKALNNIGGSFDEKRADLEQRCEYTISSMQNVIIAINKETEKLLAFTTLTQAKNLDLKNIAETIVDKIGDISGKLALKTDSLKDKAVEVIDKFTKASEIINRSSDKMTSASTLIVNNSEQGIKLMEEQSFYLNNASTNLDLIQDKLSKLNLEIKRASEDIATTMSNYNRQISKYGHLHDDVIPFRQTEPDFDQENLLHTGKGIQRFFVNHGLNIEKIFANHDMFELWDTYLKGKSTIFTDILSSELQRKQILVIRKAFDDNADFHNLVIQYLFLMDILIKKLSIEQTVQRDELINLSVNYSLDKIYFILVKALNNAD